MKTGPIWHETLLGRVIQPAEKALGVPHIACRLLRHWGAIQMVEARVPFKAAQQRLGHSRPEILLNVYAHVLDASADLASATLSGQLGGGFSAPWRPTRLMNLGLSGRTARRKRELRELRRTGNQVSKL